MLPHQEFPSDTATPNDRELLDAWQNRRDRAAFAILVDRHSPMVRSVCRRVLGNATSADDATQATFLVLARRVDQVPANTSIAGWLHGVALNMARHSRRTDERRRHHEGRFEGVSNGPDHTLDWSAVRGRLDEALSSLNPGQWAGSVGYFLEGRTQAEVAGQLGITEEALRSRIHSAMAKLRTWFGKRGIAMTCAAIAAGLSQPHFHGNWLPNTWQTGGRFNWLYAGIPCQ